MNSVDLRKPAVLYIDGVRTDYTGHQQAMHNPGYFYTKLMGTQQYKHNKYVWIWCGRAFIPRIVFGDTAGAFHACVEATNKPDVKEILLKEFMYDS